MDLFIMDYFTWGLGDWCEERRAIQLVRVGTKRFFGLTAARQSTVSVAFMRDATPNLTSRARPYPPSVYGIRRPSATASLDAFVAGCAAYLGGFLAKEWMRVKGIG